MHANHFPFIKVRGIGKTFDTLGETVYAEVERLHTRVVSPESADTRYSVYFEGRGRIAETPVFVLDRLEIGDVVEGPAVIIDETQTVVLVEGAKAVLTSRHLYITLE